MQRYVIDGVPAGSHISLGGDKLTQVAPDGSFRADADGLAYLRHLGMDPKPTKLTGEPVEQPWFDPSASATIAKNQEAAAKIAAQYDKVPVPKRSK